MVAALGPRKLAAPGASGPAVLPVLEGVRVSFGAPTLLPPWPGLRQPERTCPLTNADGQAVGRVAAGEDSRAGRRGTKSIGDDRLSPFLPSVKSLVGA